MSETAPRSPANSFRWHLAMQYHRQPWPGHSTGKAADCFECQTIEKLVKDWNASVTAHAFPPSASAAPDAHVSYVPGEDPQTAALREMVNGNRERLGIDGDGGGEGR